MRNIYKISKRQMESMYNHLQGLSFKDKKKKKSLKMFYHMDTPKDIYVRYIAYGIEPDNDYLRIIECIKPDVVKLIVQSIW